MDVITNRNGIKNRISSVGKLLSKQMDLQLENFFQAFDLDELKKKLDDESFLHNYYKHLYLTLLDQENTYV